MATAAPTKDEPKDAPKTVAVTYMARPGDPTFTRWHGVDFEHGRAVDLPESHPIVRKPVDKEGKVGPCLLEGNDWFSAPGKAPKERSASGEPETKSDYFAYASTWISKATTSGQIKSRWDNELSMRQRVDWDGVDDEKIDEIKRPKLEILRKDENTAR